MSRTTHATNESIDGFGTGARDGAVVITGLVAAIPALAIVVATLPLVSAAVLVGVVIGVVVG